MGVGLSIIDFFNRSISKTIGDISGKRMCELGDQKLHEEIALKPDGSRVWFKDWIEARGCHHYSIDIHGKNGSHPIDLGKPGIDGFWLRRFDIVTNFGTSEHVEDQYECWLKLHNFGVNGCVYIHVLPEFGKYPLSHCKYFYDQTFFQELAEANKYKLVLSEPLSDIGHIGCCYIKPARMPLLTFNLEWLKRGDNA